ncbi:hypothetical protein DXG01_007680 [Tephrocybe rancida]|nr:hypothetical protein DXG01_007680 [Tephrocybe rancida]
MASMTPAVDNATLEPLPVDASCELLGPTALRATEASVEDMASSWPMLAQCRVDGLSSPRIFDVSKQVVGQMFVHGANVLASGVISEFTSGNACVFYFLHILLDTTLGVAILYVILYATSNVLVDRLQWKGFESGVYGTPPSIKFWARQAAVYVLALTTMKIVVIIIIVMAPGTFRFGEWLLSWTHVGSGDSLQVIFTMGIFPIIMNVLQFWLIDSIVKASTKAVALDDDVSDAPHDREPLFRAPDEDDDDDYRHNDIEHARPQHPSPLRRKSSLDSTSDEFKSGTTSPNDEAADHSYPPSLSNSVSSGGSSQPRPAKNLLKNAKRRAAPAPLSVTTDYPPAVNSPGVLLSSAQPIMHVPLAPARKIEVVSDNTADAWADTWDEEDDWANRVGEEDWTGRRIEHKQSTLKNVWDADPTLHVRS